MPAYQPSLHYHALPRITTGQAPPRSCTAINTISIKNHHQFNQFNVFLADPNNTLDFGIQTATRMRLLHLRLLDHYQLLSTYPTPHANLFKIFSVSTDFSGYQEMHDILSCKLLFHQCCSPCATHWGRIKLNIHVIARIAVIEVSSSQHVSHYCVVCDPHVWLFLL